MKHVLYVIPFCPHPADSGGKVRILNTIKELSKSNQLTILGFYDNEKEINESTLFFDKLKIKYTFIKLGKYKSIFLPTPYWFSNWYSPDIIKHLKQLNFSEYNSVLVETSQLLYLIDYFPKNTKTIFVAQDISTVSFWRRLLEVNNFKKVIHFYRLAQVALYEKKYLKLYKNVVVMSPNDKKLLNKLFKITNSIISQNGTTKVDFMEKDINNNLTLGYLGSSTHSPNINTIKFITNNLAPITSNKFIIAGSNNKYLDINQNNVKFIEFIPNTKEFYQHIDILVAPIFSGSGSRIKIIESLSFGIPVITTPIGGEGIDIVNPYLSIVKDYNNPNAWTTKIKNVYKNIQKQDKRNLKKQLDQYLWSNTLKSVSQLL